MAYAAHALTAIDAALRDLCRTPETPFGGKIFFIGGDFRQMLPVVKKGGRRQIVEACLKNCSIWLLFQQHRLTKNMRANNQ